jgi:hypothetical protein
MGFDHVNKYMQLFAAVLTIPAAAAGTYSVYQSYFSTGAVCDGLRNSVLATMEKGIPAETMYLLMRKDAEAFDKSCAKLDPDASVIFQSALKQLTAPALTATATAAPLDLAPPRPRAPALLPRFEAASMGSAHAWAVLIRGDKDHRGDINFDGFAISESSLPPAGTVLTARRMMPVYSEPHAADRTAALARLHPGTCVQVVATRPSGAMAWAEVVPAFCS